MFNDSINIIKQAKRKDFQDEQVKMQKNNQNGNQSEGHFPRASQKVYSAFANILMKYELNKPQNQAQASIKPEKKQGLTSNSSNRNDADRVAEENLEEASSNSLTQNNQQGFQSGFTGKNKKATIQDNEASVIQQAQSKFIQNAKRLIKKSGKMSLNPQNQNETQKIIKLNQKMKLKNSPVVQIVDSQQEINEQEDEQQAAVAEDRSKNKKEKKKLSQFPQLLQITPQINIYEDISIKRYFQGQEDELLQNTSQMRQVDFIIEIQLLSNDELLKFKQKQSKVSSYFTQYKKVHNHSKPTAKSLAYLEKNIGSQSEYYFDPTKERQGKGNKVLEMNEFQQAQSRPKAKPKATIVNQNTRTLNSQTSENPMKKSQSQPQLNKKTELVYNQNTQLQRSRADSQVQKRPQIRNYFEAFKNRSEPMNTRSATLRDLVDQLFKRKIINQALYGQFVENHQRQDIFDYINKFYSGKLHRFDYNAIKFTMLDHRRISELLVNLFHEHYFNGNIYHKEPKVQEFLNSLYQLEAQDYFNLYTKIDRISGIKWWSKILLAQDERLMEVNKERRIARRKAQQASLAVRQLVENAKRRSAVSEANQTEGQKGQESEKVQKNKGLIGTFFGPSETSKANIKRRKQQQAEVLRIREMVNNKFGSNSRVQQQPQENNSNKMIMRKKIKFY